jgi:uncharacterized protein (DUF39 family)
VDYASLNSGTIELSGQAIQTAPLSSRLRAREIAETLKRWIAEGSFTLTEPQAPLPLK